MSSVHTDRKSNIKYKCSNSRADSIHAVFFNSSHIRNAIQKMLDAVPFRTDLGDMPCHSLLTPQKRTASGDILPYFWIVVVHFMIS
jgi:hypothetical protein